jgi:hypothetical protein
MNGIRNGKPKTTFASGTERLTDTDEDDDAAGAERSQRVEDERGDGWTPAAGWHSSILLGYADGGEHGRRAEDME